MRAIAFAGATATPTLVLAQSAGTEGDAAAGEKVFAKCKTCHEIADLVTYITANCCS